MHGALRFPWLPLGCMLWDLVLRKHADSCDPPGHFISGSFSPFPLVILWPSHLQISNDFRGSLFPLLTERSLFAAFEIAKTQKPRLLFYLQSREYGHMFGSCEPRHRLLGRRLGSGQPQLAVFNKGLQGRWTQA